MSADKITERDTLEVGIEITNTGKVAGKEVVQLYVAPPNSTAIRPVKELKGFEKILLRPGETESVAFTLDKRSFAYYNLAIEDWFVESGEYSLQVVASSRDIRLQKSVTVVSSQTLPATYSTNTLVGDLQAYPEKFALLQDLSMTFGAAIEVNTEGTSSTA